MDAVTIIVLALVAVAAFLLGRFVAEFSFRARERAIREDASKRSRAVIGGRFSEQLAPFLPDFPYRPTEAKFLGQPVDLVVFEGLDGKRVESVVFLEVKTGKASLSATERSVRDAIKAGNVRFEEYRVPDEVTRG